VCGGGFSERFSPLDSFLVVILYRSTRACYLLLEWILGLDATRARVQVLQRASTTTQD